MSSNLFKSYYLNRNTDNARIIDSNEVIAQKLERIRSVMTETVPGNDSFAPVDLFTKSDSADPADLLSEEFAETAETSSNVIKASEENTPVMQQPVYEGPSPEELIAQAKEEIEIMHANAKNEIDQMCNAAIQEARTEGYEDGKRQALQEYEAARSELDEERTRLQAEYEKQIDELEPLFVSTLTGIYEKVFEVGLANQQEIIVTLLRNTMKKLDGCKNFLVHVSTQDYLYVKEHKDQLLSDSSQEGTVIDIIEDSTIRENECTIETINGIYDCGIGTQMKELRNKLILLSYDGRQES